MKTKLLTVLTLVASLACGSAFAKATGDIYDVSACTVVDGDISSSLYPLWPKTSDKCLKAGQTAYFRVRFIAPTDSTGYWNLEYSGVGSKEIANLNPLQMGILVSSESAKESGADVNKVRWATYVDAKTQLIGGSRFTDVIFSYTTEQGDFALPILLASIDSETGNIVPANYTAAAMSEYYVNNTDKWALQCTKTDGTVVTANWWARATSVAGATRVSDFALYNAGYNVQTVDFASDWETNNIVWRSVHEGSTITVGATPTIGMKAAASRAVSFYVWSTNEDAVVVTGPNLTSVACDPNRPGVKFSVAKITLGSGELSEKFTIRGVDKTKNGGWSALVLSASDHFTVAPSVEDLLEDYVIVPVRCIDLLPPTVVVQPESSTVTASSDYLKAATRFDVQLSTPVAETFKVKIQPRFVDGAGAATDLTPAEWGKYVRFSTVYETVSALPEAQDLVVTLGGAIDSVTVYVYALRSDDKVRGVNQISFLPVAVGAPPAEIQSWIAGGFQIIAQNPVITEPAEGAEISAIANIETPMTIRVEDTYADMAATNAGYKIFYKLEGDLKFTELEGDCIPGEGGILYMRQKDGTAGDLPVIVFTTPGEQTAEIYVKSPVSGKESRVDGTARTFKVLVENARASVVWTGAWDSASEEGESMATLHEGVSGGLTLKIGLDEKGNTLGKTIYAFLQPSENVTNDLTIFSAAKPFVIGMTNTTSKGRSRGLMIAKGKGIPSKNPVTGTLQLMDGHNSDDGGLNVTFSVLLYTDEYLDPNNIDQSKVVQGFESNTFDLTVTNVVPSVSYVTLNGIDSEQSGYTFPSRIPKDQYQRFTATVKDVAYDLSHDFTCKWTPYYSVDGASFQALTGVDKYGVAYVQEITGDPTKNAYSNCFSKAGVYKLVLQVKDKDMTSYALPKDWPETKYEVLVEVLDKPGVTVDVTDYVPAENADEESVGVGLTYNDADIDLYVQLKVEPAKEGQKNPGRLLLDSSYAKRPAGTDYPEGDGIYYLKFEAGMTKSTESPIRIVEMDGTDASDLSGFSITARVMNGEKNPKTQTVWSNYYATASVKVRPYNVTPNEGDVSATFSPAPNTTTNRWEVPADVVKNYKLQWRIRNDVAGDLAGITGFKGIHVTSTGGVKDYDFYCQEPTNDFIVVDFTGMTGDQQVTIVVEDKDGGIVRGTWYFTITSTKTVTTIATKPSGGRSSSPSASYPAASGIGEGHVYLEGCETPSTSSWVMNWNCGSATKKYAYAYGYRVGAVDNGALNGGKDVAINAYGNTWKTGEEYYSYKDTTRDSFLYGWILPADSSADATTYAMTVSPERGAANAVAAEITLPTEKNDDGSWTAVTAEAVFSKELYPADNMGDINADRIPDLYFVKYNFTSSSDESSTSSRKSMTLSDTDDDQASLTSYNGDLDYLPAMIDASVAKFSTNMNDWVDFKAVYEVRGFGEGLNNAPDLAMVDCQGPDLVYTDPETDENSTLAKVEYLAWLEFAAAKGYDPADKTKWTEWSPERPTDPTKADTDEDGFTDGFEYYFWYRAHVGYFDANGNHVHMTGRRFDPRNPGDGTLITAAEIETAMDPLTDASVDVRLQDSDNDGLVDLIEFYLGTNPFDFDTDGDGLPDGWELMVSGTDPILSATDGATCDANRNTDGDAMAISSPVLENAVMPMPKTIDDFLTFAIIDEDGDSDGIQWLTTKDVATMAALTADDALTDVSEDFYVIETAAGEKYATSVQPFATAANVLASDLPKASTYLIVDDAISFPVRVPAGTPLAAAAPTEKTACTWKTLTTELAASNKVHACWVYGKSSAKSAEKGELETAGASAGFLALGREMPKVAAGAKVVALPSTARDVAYLHYFVYEEFGFDPRTAWRATTPLASRWQKTVYDDVLVVQPGGYAMYPTRTRTYAAYDEFLVMSFFLNNGTLAGTDVTPTTASPWTSIWAKYTTNPRGPGETLAKTASATKETTGVSIAVSETTSLDDNGADTDHDGVPDGWELYIMAGPKNTDGTYVFAKPYDGFDLDKNGKTVLYSTPRSYWSPFVDYAQDSATDNPNYVTTTHTDGLTEFREFGGTDSIAHYAGIQSNMTATATIARDGGDAQWINKFFPTDPWNGDTDGDGLKDSAEGSAFVYGKPADDGTSWFLPGGGLNPCSVDTDQDGLPDEWELQYKGSFDLEKGDIQKQGITNGMDGTVADAVTLPNGVNRDYDHDGLENWQEYMVGAMRCWRYDDPMTTFAAIPQELYWTWNLMGGNWVWDPKFDELGVADEDEFWYETLVNAGGKIYNPHLLTDMSAGDAEYFSRLNNAWDSAYLDYTLSNGAKEGAYYIFKDRVGNKSIQYTWVDDGTLTGGPLASVVKASGSRKTPSKYISCSPINEDTDQDGMDDYYELFHGMNPLLGESGKLTSSSGPCDIVFDAWANGENGFDACNLNYWLQSPVKKPRGTGFDFEVFPWLTGLATADPDGDDLRNQEEAIMPKLATTTWHHTDPTALWLTDSSYTNSLTRRFFRLPTRFDDVTLTNVTFTHGGKTYSFTDFENWEWTNRKKKESAFHPFIPDFWKLTDSTKMNWMFSFEENEGYDTDHDGISDYEELIGKFYSASEPQDADSPRRRQAMYFQGESRPSALQSMPYVHETYPLGHTDYPDDLAFLQFTVECWVRPDAASLADGKQVTILERAVWATDSNPGDKEFLRKNFQLGITGGKWFARFDGRGTLAGNCVEVIATSYARANVWTHLAMTYDAEKLVLYVNGVPEVTQQKALQPEYGASAVAVKPVTHDYSFAQEYNQVALLFGASFKGMSDGADSGKALNVLNGMGFSAMKNFYQGYLDEVRIWDGARSRDDIVATMKTRYDATLIKENQTDFYAQWSQDMRRYKATGESKESGMTPELRYHYAFDAAFSAENEVALNRAPHGFDADKAPLTRPEGYVVTWWQSVLKCYDKTAYSDPAWVPWVANTVAHLPRYDGTTLDSMYMSADFMGIAADTYNFNRTAEPVSYWTQLAYNGVTAKDKYQSTARRYHFITANDDAALTKSTAFEFTGRNLNQTGDDLVPLGGAYVKMLGGGEDAMWDENGPSENSYTTGTDGDNDGLPDWWVKYAETAYAHTGALAWETLVNYGGQLITAGEAYRRDIARGYYMNDKGEAVTDEKSVKLFEQIADLDGDSLPDWYEELYSIQGNAQSDGEKDPDNDGLSNYQEYLLSFGESPYGMSRGFPALNPAVARSTANQEVPDYYLAGPTVFAADVTPNRHYGLYEYLGELATDHDFMEDWWESQYNLNYSSTRKYDPLNDADGDGWSNFAECRAYTWGGGFSADLINMWLDSSTLYVCHPRPAIGVQMTYRGVQNVANAQVVARTRTTGPRWDATFCVPSANATATVQLGLTYADTVLRGFAHPGRLIPGSVILERVQSVNDKIYTWTVNKAKREGTFEDFLSDKHSWGPKCILVSSELNFDTIAVEQSDDEARTGIFYYAGTNTTERVAVGTVDYLTGEYTVDMTKFALAEAGVDHAKQLFRISYTYLIDKDWPQTLYFSDPTTGRVKEGLNTVEVFLDLNQNGAWDAGEPYGCATGVKIGWHKVPTLTIELTDDSPVLPRTALAAATSSSQATTVRIVRTAINGTATDERSVFKGEYVSDDHAYLTEADVISDTRPDLDWFRLNRDANAEGITSLESASYDVKVETTDDSGEVRSMTVASFTKLFETMRPVARGLAPVQNAPVYSVAPTFRFYADEAATAFRLQICDPTGTNELWNSGVKMLPGRTDLYADAFVCAYTAPVYVDLTTNASGKVILVDGSNYTWRVALLNAKFNTVDESDYSDLCAFQMDVANTNRYPLESTGYGRVKVAVRYYGPARTNTLANAIAKRIVVEAFENADFTGQPLARVLATTNLLDSLTDVSTVNATLAGVKPGTVYVRAFIDRNSNGVCDRFESWGYANDIGSDKLAIYNPAGVTVSAAMADVKKPQEVTVYIEDTDVNQNEFPDCVESLETLNAWVNSVENPEYDASTGADDDYDGFSNADELLYGSDPRDPYSDDDPFPDGYEAWADLDPIAVDTVTERATYSNGSVYQVKVPLAYTAVAGDTMAYAIVKRHAFAVSNVVSGTMSYVLLPKGDTRTYVTGDIVITSDDQNKVFPTFGLYRYTHPSYEDWEGAEAGYIYAMGGEIHLTGNDVIVEDFGLLDIQLLHWQVYQEFGFESGVATPDGSVHTRPFYAIDKYLLASLLTDPTETFETADGKTLKSVEWSLKSPVRLNKMNYKKTWGQNLTCLKPNVSDYDGDGIPDGWELYVMYPGNQVVDMVPCVSPWKFMQDYTLKNYNADGYKYQLLTYRGYTYFTTDENGHLKYVKVFDEDYPLSKMYNGGVNPSDPYDAYTFYPDGSISDKVARKYNVETSANQLEDNDNDGLSNWAEYLATEAGYGTFDANDPYSTGERLDYFVKASDGRYVGEIMADHDFMIDSWEDVYDASFVSHYIYDARTDLDGDGWSNWAESQVKTNPTADERLSLVNAQGEDNTVAEYPVPLINATLSYNGGEFDFPVVIKAARSARAGQTDATWKIAGSADGATECSRFLGFNPNKEISLNLGPGNIAEQSLQLHFFDPGYYTETISYDTNKNVTAYQVTFSNIDSAPWGSVLGFHDTPDGAGSDTGTFPGGTINYKTGDITIDFTQYQYDMVQGTSTAEQDIRCHWDLSSSFVRVTWKSRLVSSAGSKSTSFSVADEGYLREGLNNFIAFGDLNGNGEWDEGEPLGVARKVNVGWDRVTDLAIEMKDAAVPSLELEVEKGQRLYVVRTAINGKPLSKGRTVYAKTFFSDASMLLTAADFTKTNELDFDSGKLLGDAAELGIANILNATYEIRLSQTNSVKTLLTQTRSFAAAYAAPTPCGACTNAGYLVMTAQPALQWNNASDFSLCAVQIATDADFTKVVYAATNAMPIAANGVCTYKPNAYVGQELTDQTVYYWRVAGLDAKYQTPDWSKTASFKTNVDSTDAGTGCGKLAAEVRYYGPSKAVLSNVVVGVYVSADFAGTPVARKRLAGDAKVSSLTNALAKSFVTVSTNVLFDGIKPGSYYVMAFIDVNTNGVRDAYETWGYVCKVANEDGDTDLYTPVALDVVATKAVTPSAFLVMEDTDVNQNQTPDCAEDMTAWVEMPETPDPDRTLDVDGDGLDFDGEDDACTDPYSDDTDGDGMDDGWEVRYASTMDPLRVDGTNCVPNDVMAYAVENLYIVTKKGKDYAVFTKTLEDGTETNILYTTFEVTVDGVKTLVAGAPTEIYVARGEFSTRRDVTLVHSAVYDYYGYATNVARVCSNAVHTANFTAFWKYVTDKKYLPEFGIEYEPVYPGVIDSNNNGIDDGWELYVAFARVAPVKSFPVSNLEAIKHAFDHNYDPYDAYSVFKLLPDDVRATLVKFTNEEAFRLGFADAGADYWNYAASNDVMAVAENVNVYLARREGKLYAIRPDGSKNGEICDTNKLYTTFELSNGQLVVGAPTALQVKDVNVKSGDLISTNVVLIHSAVYDWYGFNRETARVVGADNTKPFTRAWKFNTNKAYLPAFGVESEPVGLDTIDSSANTINDGWELYVGFADIAPVKSFPTSNHDLLSCAFGHNVYGCIFDPYQPIIKDTDGTVIDNKDVFDYLLLGDVGSTNVTIALDTLTDTDMDGLANYIEWSVTRDKGGITLFVTNAVSDTTTPDYFRVLEDGEYKGQYVGEAYNGAEWIEGVMRSSLGMGVLAKAGTRDLYGSGWDMWNIVRNAYAASDANNSHAVRVSILLKYMAIRHGAKFTGTTEDEAVEFHNANIPHSSMTSGGATITYVCASAEECIQHVAGMIDEKANSDLDLAVKTLQEAIAAAGTSPLTSSGLSAPSPSFSVRVKYAGNGTHTIAVEVYQTSSDYSEYGEQMTAKWTKTDVQFDSGSANLDLDPPTDVGSIKQGPARFVAYIDNDGNSKFSDGDTYGTAEVNVGYAGGDIEITLAAPNAALPVIDLNANSNLVQSLAIIRTAVNGKAVEPRGVLTRNYSNNVARSRLYPGDFVSPNFIGVDRFLAADYDEDELKKIETVTYAIVDGKDRPFSRATFTNAQVLATVTIPYSTSRDTAKLNPIADALESNATLSFKVPTDSSNTKFWIKSNGLTFGGARGFVIPGSADGLVTIELAEYVTNLTAGAENTFQIALGNDKFGQPAATDYSAEAKQYIGADAIRNAGFTIDVKHPTAEAAAFTNGTIVVAAYDLADLAEPVAWTTGDYTNKISLAGLVKGKSYYVAAWYAANTADGRGASGLKYRQPYDTWGYVSELGSNTTSFAARSVKAFANASSSTNVVWLQDTDYNNNVTVDREENGSKGLTAVYRPFPDLEAEAIGIDETLDFDEDDVPDVIDPDPVFPSEDDDVETAIRIENGDLMAYEDVTAQFVAVGTTTSEDDWTVYVLLDPSNEDRTIMGSDGLVFKQTPASSLRTAATTYVYGKKTTSEYREKLYGLGHKVTLTAVAGKVRDAWLGTLRLVHAQVYAQNGFNTLTASRTAYLAGDGVNTKVFTLADKSLVPAYLDAIGVTGIDLDPYKRDAQSNLVYQTVPPYGAVLRTDGVWALVNADLYATDPADADADDIADGWELYTMFGETGLEAFAKKTNRGALAAAKVSPFNATDALLPTPAYVNYTADRQLKLVEAFDHGYYPTDPWLLDTDGDGVLDVYAYHYHLKNDDAGEDWDGDILSNYAEYLITEVFKYAKCDPDVYATNDGVCDYYQKIGDLYLGEIFTDHDQVGDEWEGDYPTVANRGVYDPDRDDDSDGWSNYAEYCAGTDPSSRTAYSVYDSDKTLWTMKEYPIPTVTANLVYNGGIVTAPIVVKAWSEAEDPDRAKEPAAIWTITTTALDESSKGETDETKSSTTSKFLGRKAKVARSYHLSDGTLVQSTVKLYAMDKNYTECTLKDGKVASETAGTPEKAAWYRLAIDDANGALKTPDGVTIGSVDYKTGVVSVDFAASALAGRLYADKSLGRLGDTTNTVQTTVADLVCLDLDNSYFLVDWDAATGDTTSTGTYYLADPDAVTADNPSRGYLGEGKYTFVAFVDGLTTDGKYSAGEPYGFVSGVDVGHAGAAFTLEMTKMHPVFARINMTDGTSDRTYYWGIDSGNVDAADYMASVNTNYDMQVAAEALSGGICNHVRIVPYLISGTYQDNALINGERTYIEVDRLLQNRVVAEFDVNTETHPYITEADFLTDGKFDIDWDLLGTYEFAQDSDIIGAVGDLTAVKYRMILGKDGPIGRLGDNDTQTVVRAFSTLIERRFEPTASRTLPSALKLAEGEVLSGARPTFTWRLDENTDVKGYAPSATLAGCSYTAFEIQVKDVDSGVTVYDSGVVRAPAQDADGVFSWTAPLSAGDQTPLAKVFSRAGNYAWRVAMYNAKFKPGNLFSKKSTNQGWSEWSSFSTAVGQQQVTDAHTYSTVKVAVKYAGPVDVLKFCDDLTKTNGTVRLQAFASADCVGEPLSESFITDRISLTNAVTNVVNAALYGLKAGTYYLRAYIDSNGNFKKDDFESWGKVKTAVTVPQSTTPQSSYPVIWIEDADIDGDWLPDALEYVLHGNLTAKGMTVVSGGRIAVKTNGVETAIMSGKANFSKSLPGVTLTFFENLAAAKGLLGFDGSLTSDAVALIQDNLDRKIKAGTFAVKSLTMNANGVVTLEVGADVEVADGIAGHLFSPIYTLTAPKTFEIKVYQKTSLLVTDWGKPVYAKTITLSDTVSETITIETGLDPASGFFKVDLEEVEQ